jgi:DNA-binding NarL/FixJ family response regulator
VRVTNPGNPIAAKGGPQERAGAAPAPGATGLIRVAVVEDEDWMRDSLAGQIGSAAHLQCVGCYRTGEEALRHLPSTRPDVVLMDINLPGMNGIECVRRLKEVLPESNVLMLTVYEESDRIFDSLKAGATGYLLKRAPEQELIEAIAAVQAGGSPMSGLIARKVVQFFKQLGQANPELEKLSPREREILDLLSEGAAYKEIARTLDLSINTIRMNIRNTYRKLQVHSRGEVVAKYMRH